VALIHGRTDEAEATVSKIEAAAAEGARPSGLPPSALKIRLRPRQRFGLAVVMRTLVGRYRTRSILGLSLMIAQAFTYNAIFFTYALVLNCYYAVPAESTGFYLFPFALSNFLGPIVLGPLFDTIGRRQMISGTFAASACLLLLTGWLFAQGRLTATGQVALWTMMFFFASPAASSAYLTVSEIFPLEIRALAIAIFYSAGTAVGGIVTPWLFGVLIDSGSRGALFCGYSIAATLMLVAAALESVLGVAAERVSLEAIASPLSADS